MQSSLSKYRVRPILAKRLYTTRRPKKKLVALLAKKAAGVPIPKSEYFSSFYQQYIHSKAWRKKRSEIFALRGRNCEDCRKPHYRMEVHHLTYVRLGRELPSDLRVLCPPCHEARHKDRASIKATQSNTLDPRFDSARRAAGPGIAPVSVFGRENTGSPLSANSQGGVSFGLLPQSTPEANRNGETGDCTPSSSAGPERR